MNLPVIYDDEDLIVIAKPSGIRVDEVARWIGATLVHRLDKDTSGVMVLAKNDITAANLKKQFEERRVSKKYIALVHGQMKEDEGLITLPLAKHPKNRTKVVVGTSTDRSAITAWKKLKTVGDMTLVELTPHTGRTHQLRVHLKSIGHPIVSDPIYGFAKRLKQDQQFCPRLFLHAQYLQFTHPTSGTTQEFEVLLPDQLRQKVGL